MKTIRGRIKSVTGTMHITRAMQLVASSKMRRAAENAGKSRFFFDTAREAVQELARSQGDSPYLTQSAQTRTCCIVIAGDRGLAGGYNEHVFRALAAVAAEREVVCLPIGRRAAEHCHRHYETLPAPCPTADGTTVADCLRAAETVLALYDAGKIGAVLLIDTAYRSPLLQEVELTPLLPITPGDDAGNDRPRRQIEYDGGESAVLRALIPQYLTGMLWGALTRSLLSETAARQNAMDSATRNAQDMIDRLTLTYNRARQGAITQEITEIIAGAESH